MTRSITSPANRQRKQRSIHRVISAFAVAAAVVATASPAAAQSEASFEVTPTTGLDAAGDTVRVEGKGYPGDDGFYVRLCAAPTGTLGTADGRVEADDCDGQGVWVTNSMQVPGTTANDGGSWDLDLDVAGAFATATGSVDCTETESCGVFVRRDTGDAADFSFDAFTPLSFDAATAPPTVDDGEETGDGGVELTLSGSSDLVDGEVIAVDGAAYTAGVGIYAQFCAAPTGKPGTADGRATQCYPGQDGTHTVWITPIDDDGSFSTPLQVEKTFEAEDGTEVDCAEDDACGVFTRRDHNGGDDFSQDAFVGVAFGDGVAAESNAALAADRIDDLDPTGDRIQVIGDGFRPSIDYVVALCVAGDLTTCDFDNAAEVTSAAADADDDSGTFATDLDVQAEFGDTDCLAEGTKCVLSTSAVSLSEAVDEVEFAVSFASLDEAEDDSDSNILPWVIGGVLIIVIGAGGAIAYRKRATD